MEADKAIAIVPVKPWANAEDAGAADAYGDPVQLEINFEAVTTAVAKTGRKQRATMCKKLFEGLAYFAVFPEDASEILKRAADVMPALEQAILEEINE